MVLKSIKLYNNSSSENFEIPALFACKLRKKKQQFQNLWKINYVSYTYVLDFKHDIFIILFRKDKLWNNGYDIEATQIRN